jgi:hypothetical protein
MAFQATLGSIILYRTGKNRYSPALITGINEDGRLNLTVFSTNGQTGLARDVCEGDHEGEWCPTGVDAQEAAMAKAPPVSETGKLSPVPPHPPPLTYPGDPMAKGATEKKK